MRGWPNLYTNYSISSSAPSKLNHFFFVFRKLNLNKNDPFLFNNWNLSFHFLARQVWWEVCTKVRTQFTQKRDMLLCIERQQGKERHERSMSTQASKQNKRCSTSTQVQKEVEENFSFRSCIESDVKRRQKYERSWYFRSRAREQIAWWILYFKALWKNQNRRRKKVYSLWSIISIEETHLLYKSYTQKSAAQLRFRL